MIPNPGDSQGRSGRIVHIFLGLKYTLGHYAVSSAVDSRLSSKPTYLHYCKSRITAPAGPEPLPRRCPCCQHAHTHSHLRCTNTHSQVSTDTDVQDIHVCTRDSPVLTNSLCFSFSFSLPPPLSFSPFLPPAFSLPVYPFVYRPPSTHLLPPLLPSPRSGSLAS